MAKKTPKTKPTFDPGKNYQWKPDTEFKLSGAEYDLIFKSLRANLDNPVFLAHVQQFEALKLMEKLFVEGVENGIVTEIVPEQTELKKV